MLCEPDTKCKFRLLIPFNLLLLTLFVFKYFDNIDEILERLTERISGTPSFSISRKMRAQLVLVFTNIHAGILTRWGIELVGRELSPLLVGISLTWKE